jgi:hypothetical protein
MGDEDAGWDAECEHCEVRMSDPKEELGSKQQADDWAYWHKKDCEPVVRLLSPDDLEQERQSLEQLRQKYPQMYGETTTEAPTADPVGDDAG